MGTRAAIYGRQSKDKKISISDQLDLGRARAKAEGWELVQTFQEGKSASRHGTATRDEWNKVRAAVEQGDVDLVWIWAANRGDRIASSWMKFVESCRDANVRLYVEVDEHAYNFDIARDWKWMGNAGVDSHYEAELIHQSTMRAKDSARTRGDLKAYMGGRARYGWRDPGRNQRWEVDPAASTQLREIADLVLAGGNLVAIHRKRAKKLVDSYGVPVTYKRLNLTLHSPVLAGLTMWPDGTVAGGVEGPVDVGTYDRLQALFASQARGATPTGRYPLGRVLACGKCGNQLTGSIEKGRANYRCCTPHPGTGHATPCKGTTISADVVHAVIESKVRKWVAESPRAKHAAQDRRVDAERTALEAEWSRLQDQLANLEQARLRGEANLSRKRLTAAQFSQHERVIESEFARVEHELAVITKTRAEPVRVQVAWERLTPAEKCKLVAIAFVTPIRIRTQAETGGRNQRDRLSGLTLLD